MASWSNIPVDVEIELETFESLERLEMPATARRRAWSPARILRPAHLFAYARLTIVASLGGFILGTALLVIAEKAGVRIHVIEQLWQLWVGFVTVVRRLF